MTSKLSAWVAALNAFGFAACSLLPAYIGATPMSEKIGHARLLLRLSPDPPRAGSETATLQVRGVPAASLSNTEVTFSTTMPQMGMSGSSGTAKAVAGHAGEWTFDVDLGMSGAWNITVGFAGPPGGSATFNFNAVSESSSGSGTQLVRDDGLGHVHMATSCQSAVQHDFDRGLAMLYSFWYDYALKTFDDVIARDPNCAIAYWGAAMTYNHPLWGPPTATDLKAGISYLTRSQTATEHSPKESAYLDAARILFGDGDPTAKRDRDEAYEQRMAQIYSQYRDDDSALFYSLAVEGTYRYAEDPAKVQLAGRLAEMVHRHQPLHPGALHYIIHAYDVTGYESRALDAAREYAASAPAIPHALHMPSHTFFALGLWKEANATNERAWTAGEAIRLRNNGPLYDSDYHVLWFLVYGYLQTGQYAKARTLAEAALHEYNRVVAVYHQVDEDTAEDRYNMIGMLAPVLSYAFETGDYSMSPAISDDGLFPALVAARMQYETLRALKSHDDALAKQRRDELVAFAKRYAGSRMSSFVQRLANETDGLYQIQGGNPAAGMHLLADASSNEAANDVGQPLIGLPAQELYGRELLLHGNYSRAESVLNRALQMTPNRPKALLWLAEAARRNGDRATAVSAGQRFKAVWSADSLAATDVLR